MTTPAFDVVVVADFTGSPDHQATSPGRFEIMTLFFLASWLEFAGRSRNLPLHIVCIGEAPETVRALAERCGARITSHPPLLFGGFANKLRGFEVEAQTDHVLLLDSDMLVLSEIHELPDKLGGECIAAAVANGPTMVPRHQWPEIYDVLGIPCPTTHVVPLNRELDTFQCAPYRDQTDFPPYYNGGVVYAPWRSRLGEVWRDHMARISTVAKRKAKISNQPSLVTSITYLQQQGFEFRLLPPEYHVRWQHISAGAVTSRQARLLHTIGFGRWKSTTGCTSAKALMDAYHSNTLRLTRKLRSHRGPLVRAVHRATRGLQMRDCHRVHRLMTRLYDNHVRELVP